ncbi:hypothetical protein RO3G_04286 [Rhizopus delemar RA 99-880]|uniref:Uncharacterized protein n=1 Tax=Rhizopus delemar (strain RA 99-880 / ATCC MYA-4621 / FGSC 9543 / NRRL 43880) TaxID=246409 RepID=I1BTQ1_RHIO9|nr:hypothetical protein RO3G_04286 [Rhizopus delemar RA 99-880]|eukprot:EIE79581.1 hypothetical protein RO3G_04286 [Rhizopus delemar RA 99-880]
MTGRKNKYDWILIQAFMRAWYSEMERVYEHVTSVADILRTQIEELSNALCDANKKSRSENKTQQFIFTCLKDIRESCCEKESIKSMHSRFQHHHRHLENRIQFMLNEKHKEKESVDQDATDRLYLFCPGRHQSNRACSRSSTLSTLSKALFTTGL